jgi:hypothetical protein
MANYDARSLDVINATNPRETPQSSGNRFGQDDVATGTGQSRQHQSGADIGTDCSPEKVSTVRRASVLLFRPLGSCFALTQTQGGVKENLQVLFGFLGTFRFFQDDLADACRGRHLHSRVDRDGRLPALLIPGDATAGTPDARVLASRGSSRRSADIAERVCEPSTSGRHGDGGRRSYANLRRGERPGGREPGLARAPSGLLPDALGSGPCRRPSAGATPRASRPGPGGPAGGVREVTRWGVGGSEMNRPSRGPKRSGTKGEPRRFCTCERST